MLRFAPVLLAFAAMVAAAEEPAHPYKTAKAGDVLKYKVNVNTGKAGTDTTFTQTVSEVSDKAVTISNVATLQSGKELKAKTVKIDLAQPFNPVAGFGNTDSVKKEKDGTDKLKIGDKDYDCTWTEYKAEPDGKVRFGSMVDVSVKAWTCKEFPGVVRMTLAGKMKDVPMVRTYELLEYTPGKKG